MQNSNQAEPKRARLNSKGSVPPSRPGGHESISDAFGSDMEVSDEDDISDNGQNGLDDARNALKNLQMAIEKAGKSDTFAKDMEKKVRTEERRLKNMFEKEDEEWHNEDENFQCQFSSLMIAVLSSRRVKANVTSNGTGDKTVISDSMQSAANHPLYLKTQGLLESARNLVSELDSIGTHALKAKLPQDPKEGLEKDTAEARRLIARGAEATALAIEKQLVYNGHKGQLRDRKEEAFLNDINLQAMLDMGRDALNEGPGNGIKPQSWGIVARHLQRGMYELVKALPRAN
ncbi:uncharacterized protein ARB_06177 [Trichophyton benhamiae CBS 112371]|uniref:Uncharacterized protein n=1 Tax=Arthroderma benhamiae (strain ATCC MYA-4681 / CBS 112371) TaxID=663331 RepID=D4APK9_ARTBC|nr:uncharacterized protein ARB_06177 [Trichophyton benhamiae CBS 112371]EFE35220.1 hypothetical protein ARB_06177 [Trichophyton benhamiae CBS 112371]